ncbi:MAG TPA: hypothetical protein VHZ73_01815 [Vicinamibacterales bacterium]|nr:hypothetical protein [Vicinamibacterales bacterium]
MTDHSYGLKIAGGMTMMAETSGQLTPEEAAVFDIVLVALIPIYGKTTTRPTGFLPSSTIPPCTCSRTRGAHHRIARGRVGRVGSRLCARSGA